ncbi:hypothetical protein PHYBOEH_000728 [Phytophthora boehmeriae]|uniref:Temptin Cys/Cys disulfide domain-containing protein n=1 Tax=Phytophthora boehmeriae TaxID=109152 RepID=A0A8T1X0G7_9STRA|nr:hypothetical protein PHYBOEH_000728 [Phytophthora boehmeriae]
MKTCAAFAATALIVATTMNSAVGMKSYLEEIPNGSSFEQALGHPDGDSSQFTKFGTAFGAADHTWSADFCKATFPGASMTNGEAFGDPCCTWTKGGTPDFTVTAFTTTPGKATVCASGGGGGSAAGGSGAETPAGSGAETPAGSGAETPAGSGTESSGAETPAGSGTESSGAETPAGSGTESSGDTESSTDTETSTDSSAGTSDSSSTSQFSPPTTPAPTTPSTSTGGSNSWSTPSTPSTGWTPPATGGGCAARNRFRH